MNFRQLMRKIEAAARRTAENVAKVLQSQRPGTPAAGTGSQPPRQDATGRPAAPPLPGGIPEVLPDDLTGDGPRWIGPELDQDQLDLVHGTMHDIVSSNVHSIGMQAQPGARTGTLLIRFLGTQPNGRRGGKGPTYAYRDVPIELFRAFRTAASKGGFVWDHVRVRGTVSGHRFPYELIGVVNGYVPRQAGLKRGQAGEFFLRRTWTGYKRNRQTGKLEKVTLQSQLPERRVSGRGPNPDRGPGLDRLRLQGGR